MMERRSYDVFVLVQCRRSYSYPHVFFSVFEYKLRYIEMMDNPIVEASRPRKSIEDSLAHVVEVTILSFAAQDERQRHTNAASSPKFDRSL